MVAIRVSRLSFRHLQELVNALNYILVTPEHTPFPGFKPFLLPINGHLFLFQLIERSVVDSHNSELWLVKVFLLVFTDSTFADILVVVPPV
jgi:hypothetical protein